MFDLNNLYANHKLHGENPLCAGCSILEKQKPCHSVMDYEQLNSTSALFVSDSFKYKMGRTLPFSAPEYKLIAESYPEAFACTASVKCPGVKEADMSPDNMKLCRVHLEATVDKVKPTLVFACGNLAFKMLTKKSGIMDKRGKAYEYITDAGTATTVIPVYHPYSVIKEPRHEALFKADIQNAYEKYILGRGGRGQRDYTVVTKIEDLPCTGCSKATELAVDIETTGLNFKKDKIMTIALSSREKTYVIPIDHKDSPWTGEQRTLVLNHLKDIMVDQRIRKIFHNAKFDVKFLLEYGMIVRNIWDTKIMHHFIDENMPKSLMDLVRLYFPHELD